MRRLRKRLGVDAASLLFEFDPPVKLDPAPGPDFAGLSPNCCKIWSEATRASSFPGIQPKAAITGRYPAS